MIGCIVEIEVYYQDGDKVCYVYSGWCIKCIEVMFMEGGYVYVYLCYGIYYLFNIVIGKVDVGLVVFICVLEFVYGQFFMLE